MTSRRHKKGMADNKLFTRLYEEAAANHRAALARFEADKTTENHQALLKAHAERVLAWETLPHSERVELVEQARAELFPNERTT